MGIMDKYRCVGSHHPHNTAVCFNRAYCKPIFVSFTKELTGGCTNSQWVKWPPKDCRNQTLDVSCNTLMAPFWLDRVPPYLSLPLSEVHKDQKKKS